jgi:hypothetical protein
MTMVFHEERIETVVVGNFENCYVREPKTMVIYKALHLGKKPL